MNKCYLTIFCNHYRDWRQPFKPCNESYHENQNKIIQIDSVFPVCITILCCSVYRVSNALLHFLTAHITGFSLFVLPFWVVLYTGYLVHCCIFLLLTLQGFPRFVNNFSLFNLHDFPFFTKKFRFTGFSLFVLPSWAAPYTGYLVHCYIFSLLTLQGFPCLYYHFELFCQQGI